MSALLEAARRRLRGGHDLHDPEVAWGACFLESSALVRGLGEAAAGAALVRVRGQNYPGREHWAVLDGWDETAEPAEFQVVDLTDPSSYVPVWTDTYDREDVTPGDNPPYFWERAK